ncbi:MAG: hypothetical protein FOGNACKC_02274 [Anaerolineae bacterium]|nr:hypothetical protein [Anaerolineae bacterium]
MSGAPIQCQIEYVEPTADDWRRLYHEAKTEAATATDPETKTARLMVCMAIEIILAELEAGEAPAPAPSFPPLCGEGRRGSGSRPRPRAPQDDLVESDFTSPNVYYEK